MDRSSFLHSLSAVGRLVLLTGAFLAAEHGLSGQNASGLATLTEVLQITDDPALQRDILTGISEALTGVRTIPMPPGWDNVAARLSRCPDPEVRSLTLSLSAVFGSSAAFQILRTRLMDASAPLAVRRSALESLLQSRDAGLAQRLRQLLSEPELRAAALRGLAAFEQPETPPALLNLYPVLTPVEKRDALATLASRLSFARILLNAVREGTIPKSDLTADIIARLRNLRSDSVDGQIAQLWGTARDTPADVMKEITRYKSMLESGPAGDPDRGRLVYERVCQQCHTLFGTGGKVGPDLTGYNRGDLEYLLQNILDPNALIPNAYRSSSLETADEWSLTGIITRSDNTALTIVTANDTVVVPRNEVKSIRHSEISMMPEGLLAPLAETEVRDLMRYLQDTGATR